MNEAAQKQSREAAFDLLDALSRSGGLTMEHADLHIVMGATHSFEQVLQLFFFFEPVDLSDLFLTTCVNVSVLWIHWLISI